MDIDENSQGSSKNEVEEINTDSDDDNEVESVKESKPPSRRQSSDSSSIEMIEEFSRKKSVDEDEENDEASSSSATSKGKFFSKVKICFVIWTIFEFSCQKVNTTFLKNGTFREFQT